MREPVLENAFSVPSIAVIGLLVFGTLLAASGIRRSIPRTASVFAPMLVASATSVGALFYRLIVDPYLVSDEGTWHEQSIAIAEYLLGRDELPSGLHGGKEGYPWVVGALYAATEPAPLVPIALGMLLFVLLVPVVGALTATAARELQLPERSATRAILFSCYFSALCPATAIWAPRMLREIICMFLVGTMILGFLKFLAKPRFAPLVLVAFSASIMLSVRAQVAMGVVAGLILSGVVVYATKFRSVIARVVVVVPVFLGIFTFTWTYVDSTADLSVESIALRNQALSEASSAFEGGDKAYQAGSIIDIILFNLPRAAFGPFPHEFNGSGAILLAIVSNVFWLFCVVGATLAFVTIRAARPLENSASRRFPRSVVVMTTISLTLVAILSITAGNYGLVVRMRLMPLTALIPIAALGYTLWRNRRENIGRARNSQVASGSPTLTS